MTYAQAIEEIIEFENEAVETEAPKKEAKVVILWDDAKVTRFVAVFMKKYTHMTGSNVIRQNLEDCIALYQGNISIAAFEKKTGIACDALSLEETYQIGL